MTIIDERMRRHSRRLVDEVRIQPTQAHSVATTIFDEIRGAIDADLLKAIRDSSPMDIQRRLLFFEDYNVWDVVIRGASKCPTRHPLPPQIVQRAYVEMQWVVHLYCSFVFAGDGLFEVLKKRGPAGSCVRKCSAFIRENPVRALRNAVAHGNWQVVAPSFGSLDYWARKGESKDEPILQFHASLDDLRFYLDLTWCTAWASFLAVKESIGEAP
jgi:hypothetical protein